MNERLIEKNCNNEIIKKLFRKKNDLLTAVG